MGKGPAHLAGHGAAARLRAASHAVAEHLIEVDQVFPAEIASAFALQRAVAEHVGSATATGWFPLLLAGNGNSAVGVAAGLAADKRLP